MNNKIHSKYNLKKNIYFAVFSFAINIGLVFINYKVVIYYLGMDALGLWSLLMAWASVIRLGDVGMGNATLHFLSKLNLEEDWKEIQNIIDTGLLLNLFVFFILTTLGYLILNYNLEFIVKEDSVLTVAKNILPILFIGIFFSTGSSIVFGNLMGLHHGYISSYLTVFGNIIQIILVIMLVPKIGLIGLAWAQFIQFLTILFLGLFIIKSKAKSKSYFPTNFSFSTLKTLLNYSLKVQFANTANGLFEPLSKIMISRFGDLTSQGIYEIAYKTVSLSRNMVISGLSASLPVFTDVMHKDKLRSYELYRKAKRKLMKSISAMALAIIVLSPLVSFVWIGEIVNNYIIFVILIYLGFYINVYGETAYKFGLAVGKMKNNILTTLFRLISLVLLSLLFGTFYQDIGVVTAVMISLAVGGILINYLNEKLLFHRLNYNDT